MAGILDAGSCYITGGALLVKNPDPGPQSGSIAGVSWFDENADSVKDNSESSIPSTPVGLITGGVEIDSTKTDGDGKYYFGGLDLDQCYQVRFGPADPTLTFTAAGADNAAGADGLTGDNCISVTLPDIVNVDAGFVPVPPVTPPKDYAICGSSWLAADGSVVSNTMIKMEAQDSGETYRTNTDAKGNYAFVSLPAGDYRIYFELPGGYEFTTSSNELTSTSSYVGQDGWTPMINLPAAINTQADDACSIRHVNAGYIKTPVALDPTVANDDEDGAFVGDTLIVNILDNDMPCDGGALAVDIIKHNVPGTVTYDAATGSVTIANTTKAGTYSIEYGLRGNCGSYDTAVVTITLEEVPPPPPPLAPDAPASCIAAVGKSDKTYTGVHVDINVSGGQSKADFATGYNFYDVDGNLVYAGLTADANAQGPRFGFDFGIYFRKREHGIEVLDVATVRSVENGVESLPLDCTREVFTPIALDVDGSGHVEIISGKFSIDMDGDGIEEKLLEWFAPGEGILISGDYTSAVDGSNLYGDTGGKHTDGFAKLALKDLNRDGQLTGAELSTLRIWTDSNSNARVDTGEISTLKAHSIEAVSVEHYKYSARATLVNGKSMMMRDVWFPAASITQTAR